MASKDRTAVYVIDTDYKIVYFNKALRRAFPTLRLGERCYRALCEETGPCKECPLKSPKNGGALFYNKLVQRWLEISSGVIDWPGAGECQVLFVRSIQEDNKNLFYNLTAISTYDELFELNLTEDSYRILYHLEGKYVISEMEGKLSAMLKNVVTAHMVHPDDREAFLEFWDLESLLSRLMDGTGNALKGQFRKRRMDGEWNWVLQTVVPLCQGEKEDKIVMCFIQDIHEQKMKELETLDSGELVKIRKDRLTGLYGRDDFFRAVEEILQHPGKENCCLMAIDIEHFKLFNEWHGREVGDDFLRRIAGCLKQAQQKTGGVAGYMGDDDFGILLPNRPNALTDLQNQIMNLSKQYGDNAGFLPAFGVYMVDDHSIPASTMYDRASIAMASVKGNYAKRVRRYEAGMMRKLEEDHLLLSEVQRALEQREFTFYLQPKCNMVTGKIVGMESLVRWIHPEKGMISPGEFIPLLEKNGFIANLDRYIWEDVCRLIRNWLDHGYHTVPISVNVSRIDIYTLDVAECFKELVQQYRLNPSLIEIEITESAYAEEYQIITDVVEELRKAGFTVLMDDFGSGYSSLNMLKDVNVDVLKIDMKFLDMDEQSQGKGVGILEAIVSMARLVGLRIIAEGVETPKQVEFLRNMGCLYGQGYYFYRPMSIEAFEALLKDEANIDFRGIQARQLDQLRMKELLNDDLFSEAMINNILGGIALYDVYEDQVEVVRVNEQYIRILGANPADLEERQKTILDSIYQGDRAILLDVFQRAYKDLLNGAEGEVRCLREDADTIWLHLRAFFLREQDGHRLYYGSVSDVTAQRHQEQMLESSQRALSAVVHISENDEAFMKLTEENRRTAASIFAQMSPGGMIGGYCEEGFPLYFANRAMVELLGYQSYEEFAAAIGHQVVNTIHPDDLEAVMRDIGSVYYPGLEYTTTYRMPKKDGTWFWTLDKGRIIEAEDGRLAIVSACTDISETMIAQEKLAERNTALLRQNQELYFLNHDMPGGYHRCADTPGYDFLYISDRFLEIFDYSMEEIRELFDNKFMNMIHPDDRAIKERGIEGLQKNRTSQSMEYRMLSKHGYIWVIDQTKYIEYGGKLFFQGLVLDVTEMVKLRNQMQMLVKYTPEDIILAQYRDGRIQYEIIADGMGRGLGFSAEDYRAFFYEGGYGELIQKKNVEEIEEWLAACIRNRKNGQRLIPLHFADGRDVWLSLDARFIKDEPDGITYLFINRDVTPLKQKEQELWLAGKKLESILRQAGINSWDWDFKTNTLVVSKAEEWGKEELIPGKCMGRHAVLEDFPECLMDRIPCASCYREPFLSFIDRVRNGENHESLQCEIPFTTLGGGIRWIKSACETICDEQENPVRAMGYYIDITKEKQKDLTNGEDRKAFEVLREQFVCDFKVNLTQNTIFDENACELWREETGCCCGNLYTEVIRYMGNHLVLPEFQEAFWAFCDRKRMLELYHEGKRIESMDYQRLYRGEPHWMRMILHLMDQEEVSDILCHIFIMDIDPQKRQEMDLMEISETDILTGLYNRQNAIPRMEEFLSGFEDGTAALVLFDLDHFQQANELFGPSFADTMLVQAALKLKGFFRREDILCRFGGDTFLVLCKNIQEQDAKKKLAEIVGFLSTPYKNKGREMVLSISAGFAMVPKDGDALGELYPKASTALRLAKRAGGNCSRQYNFSMKETEDDRVE